MGAGPFRGCEVGRCYVLAADGGDVVPCLHGVHRKNLKATGRLHGVLPLVFIGTTGDIEGGLLTARGEGGMLQYVGNGG